MINNNNLLETEVVELREYIELVNAIETVEYHNKNWLPQWAIKSPKRLNEAKRELLDRALTVIGSSSSY